MTTTDVRDVVRAADLSFDAIATFLAEYQLELVQVPDDGDIDGSYWGAPEAGLVGSRVYVRSDTPIHSLMHETCHAICMTAERRAELHRDAGGDDIEEVAVCFLQIVLADSLPGFDSQRMMRDMDAWGYSFRTGDTLSWFERDADDARSWLLTAGLICSDGRPCGVLRQY